MVDNSGWASHERNMVMLRGYVQYTKIPSPGVAAIIGFAAQTKPVLFESAGAFDLQNLPRLVLIQVARWG